MILFYTKGFVHIVQFVEKNSLVLVKNPVMHPHKKRLNGVCLSDFIFIFQER